MATMHVRPELLPTAAVLKAAIERSGMDNNVVGRRIGMSGNSVRLYRDGRVGVAPAMAAKLGELLKVDPATLVSSVNRRGSERKKPAKKPAKKPVKKPVKKTNEKRGRSPGGTNGAGPAARAVALLSARPADVRSVPVPVPPAVFRMEMRADGSMAIDVRAILGAKRGAELVRHLLEFGLLPDGEP